MAIASAAGESINPQQIVYSTTKSVDYDALEKLYDQYMYFDKFGTQIIDTDLVEDRGVLHLGRRSTWFKRMIDLGDSRIEAAVIGSRCVGFCLYFLGGPECEEPTVRQLVIDEGIDLGAYVYLVCVDQGWVRRRIGRTLVYRTLASLHANSVECAVTEIAASPRRNVRSHNLFRRAGWSSRNEMSLYEVAGHQVAYERYYWHRERFT